MSSLNQSRGPRTILPVDDIKVFDLIDSAQNIAQCEWWERGERLRGCRYIQFGNLHTREDNLYER